MIYLSKNYLFNFFVTLLIVHSVIGCSIKPLSGSKKKPKVFLASSDDYYKKLGLSKSTIEPWEDGMRTSGKKGTYEWWYFDATLDDGSTLIINFYTKSPIRTNRPLEPTIIFELNRPDGSIIYKKLKVSSNDFFASKEGCNVRISSNTFNGNLKDYTIHVDIEEIKADINLHGIIPSWRPNTGYAIFQQKEEHYFAWLPAVPLGKVDGSISISGKDQLVTGVGYHDHNWGDYSMLKLIHNWYWGRAQIGNYSIIAANIVSLDKYDNMQQPIFMLARNGNIVVDDFTKVKFSLDSVYTDSFTGKPVANIITYDYNDGQSHYRITFKREKNLTSMKLIDRLHGVKHFIAKLKKFDGAYIRCSGQVTLERIEGDKIVERVVEKSAIWEIMYLGHTLNIPQQ